MSFPNDRTYNFDINLQVSDGAAAQTANGWSQVGGATAQLDLGGNQGTSPVQQARIDAMLVLDVTALNIATGDESYRFVIGLSNDPAFGAGNVVEGPSILLGKGAELDLANGADSVTGRYELGFTTQIAGTLYEFMQLYVIVAGTGPSITYEGFVAVIPVQ